MPIICLQLLSFGYALYFDIRKTPISVSRTLYTRYDVRAIL